MRLTTSPVTPDGPTEGVIDLTFADGSLKGPFTASFCTPPEMDLHGCK